MTFAPDNDEPSNQLINLSTADAQARLEDRIDLLQEHILRLTQELFLLSGRLELVMRLNARIVAKIDPAYIEDPNDPEVRKRSDLLSRTIIEKMKSEAIAQALNDPEATDRLDRYFKDV